jgi:pimeloyl-ACP methyl ester carboxylesterase
MTLFPDGLDHETLEIIVPLLRTAATPEMQEHLEAVFFDLESILGKIRAPTLVVHRRDDRAAPFAHGQRLASQIPNARFLPLEGSTHPMWAGDYESVGQAILDFLVDERG